MSPRTNHAFPVTSSHQGLSHHVFLFCQEMGIEAERPSVNLIPFYGRSVEKVWRQVYLGNS